MKKRLTTIAAVGALGLGGMASTFVLAPAVVSAATSDATTTEALADRVDGIRHALGGLVEDGTLTEPQADKVAETLAEQLPGHHGFGHSGPVGHLAEVAEVLDLTEDELVAELRDGRSLADIAADQGLGRQELVDGLVAKASERVDRAVEEGRFSDAQGERLKARLAERLAALVDGDFPGPYGTFHHPGPGADWPVEPDSRHGRPGHHSLRHDSAWHESPRSVSPPAQGASHTEI